MKHCKNCNRPIVPNGTQWAHYIGPGSNIIRCDPEVSGKPYGLNAEPKEK